MDGKYHYLVIQKKSSGIYASFHKDYKEVQEKANLQGHQDYKVERDWETISKDNQKWNNIEKLAERISHNKTYS